MKKIFILVLLSLAFLPNCKDSPSDSNQPSSSVALSGQDQILIDFYKQKPVTFKDRNVDINNFWNYSNDELESEHNYVQWLFPNAREGVAPAPVLSEKTVVIMREDPEIKKNVLKSFDTMLKFLGYSRDTNSCALQRNSDFDERAENWIITNSHNHLRMSRLLLFLKYMGLDDCAKNLFDEFTRLRNDDKYKAYIANSYDNYWQNASMGIEGGKKHTDLLPK